MREVEKFLSAIGDIEDEFIEEAAACVPPDRAETDQAQSDWIPTEQSRTDQARSDRIPTEQSRTGQVRSDRIPKNRAESSRGERRRKLWRYGGVLAACLVVAVVTWASLMPSEKDPVGNPLPQEKTAKLPLLTIEEKQDAQPAEKRTKKLPAASDSVRTDANPWTEDTQVEALPVYSNQAYGAVVAKDDGDGNGDRAEKAVDAEELSDRVMTAAAAVDMEMEPEDVVVGGDGADYGRSGDRFDAWAETEQGSIQVTLDHETLIRFADSVELPEEYRIPAEQRSDENMAETAAWLLSEYSQLTGFEDGRGSVESYWRDGEQKWVISGCEKEDDIQSQIVSYNLKRVFFQLDDQGNLSGILLRDHMACSEKIEEYPIITESEARALLAQGEYVTDCGYDMPGTEYIRRVSLVYLAGERYNIFMPYYAFDVQLPAGAADEGGDTADGGDVFLEGYVDCGTYYVPAVKGEYIANMPKGATE